MILSLFLSCSNFTSPLPSAIKRQRRKIKNRGTQRKLEVPASTQNWEAKHHSGALCLSLHKAHEILGKCKLTKWKNGRSCWKKWCFTLNDLVQLSWNRYMFCYNWINKYTPHQIDFPWKKGYYDVAVAFWFRSKQNRSGESFSSVANTMELV